VDSESILKITQHVVLHAASAGNCVIVGRGSQHFLRDREDTLRVFLYAPRDQKVRRLMTRGKTEAEAQELVDTVDRARKDFVHKYFGVEWPNFPIYHAMFNTAAGEETVVQAILDYMKIFDARANVPVSAA
jgi:cytidylate kinase